MKTAISLPDPLFKEAEATAKELGISRSRLIRTALEDFLSRRRANETTRRLNRSFTENPAKPDPFLDRLVLEGMKRTEWKE